MAIYYGMNSNYAGTLFSSLNNSGTSNSLSGILGDYTSIKNGSYGKLLNKYYSLNEDTTDKKTDKTSLSTSKDDTKTLSAIESSTKTLKKTADALVKNSTGSVFSKTDIKDEDGNVTRGYDKNKIYDAVKQFVEDYNDVIDSTAKSNTKSIASSSKNMIETTIANKRLFAKIGISMDAEGKLSISEDDFKDSDMSVAKTLFNGTGSYAYQVSAKSARINYQAEHESTKANTYTNNGSYSYNYSAGNLYNSMF